MKSAASHSARARWSSHLPCPTGLVALVRIDGSHGALDARSRRAIGSGLLMLASILAALGYVTVRGMWSVYLRRRGMRDAVAQKARTARVRLSSGESQPTFLQAQHAIAARREFWIVRNYDHRWCRLRAGRRIRRTRARGVAIEVAGGLVSQHAPGRVTIARAIAVRCLSLQTIRRVVVHRGASPTAASASFASLCVAQRLPTN